MRYCQVHGHPDLFCTMTADSFWEEIQRELYPGQSPNERQDVIARVFRLKVMEMKKLLFKVGVFGKTVSKVATIEWQKK